MSNVEPIIPNLPSAARAFERKYTSPSTLNLLSTTPTPIGNALRSLDVDRVRSGQRPLGDRETLLALTAATTGEAATKPPERSPTNLLGNFVTNTRQLFTSLPMIPRALVSEARQLPSLPGQISQALTSSANPLTVAGNLAGLPGVRMVPGAYVAHELLGDEGGGWRELARNPVTTALDVLPISSGLVRRSNLGRAYEAQRQTLLQTGTPIPSGNIVTKRRPGTFTALTRRLDDAGNIERTRLGQMTSTLSGAARTTRVGQFGLALWGDAARHTTRTANQLSYKIRDVLDENKTFTPGTMEYATQQGRSLADRYRKSGITPERQSQIIDDFQFNPERITDYTDIEKAFVREFNDIQKVFRSEAVQDGGVGVFTRGGIDEYYDARTARRLNRAQHSLRQRERLAEVRTNLEDITLDPYLNGIVYASRDAARPGYTRTQNHLLADGHMMNMAARGLIDEQALIAWNRVKSATRGNNRSDINFLRTLDLIDNPRPTSLVINEAFIHFQRMSRERFGNTVPLQVDRLRQAITRRDYIKAARLARSMSKVKRYEGFFPDIDGLVDAFKVQTRIDKYLDQTKQFTPERAARGAEQLDRIVRRTPPARVIPELQRRIQEAVSDHVREVYATDPNLPQYLEYVREGNYAFIRGFSASDFRAIQRDITRTWTDLIDNGFDPIFVHKVSPAAVGSLDYPSVAEYLKTPTQVKKRTMDWSASENNPSVILTHQGMEWLTRRGSEAFIDEITNTFGKPLNPVYDPDTGALVSPGLLERYSDMVRGRVPENRVRDEALKLLNREWVPFNPGEFITWPSSKLGGVFNENIYVPRAVRRTVEQMNAPPAQRATAMFDPVMQVFRTSLLPLSPRWHIYNMFGNSMMLMMSTSPAVYRHWSQARRMMKEGLPEGSPPGGMGTVPSEFAGASYRQPYIDRWLKRASEGEKMRGVFNAMGGADLKRIWDSLGPVRTKTRGLVDRSYWLNQQVDDFHRALAYLYGYDKTLTRGMSREAAHRAGIDKVRKVFQSWDEITPMERVILRSVFPFYGWTQHVLRYVYNFPIDHPVRASIMSQFARNELEDFGTGLPERFLNMFFWGGDEEGNYKSFSLGGMNPFRDTADVFTWAGFTGNANPIISTVLTGLGVDVSSGTPSLYPDMEYDPETGRMVASSPGIFQTFYQSVIPQTRVLDAMLGRSADFKRLAERDPSAAGRFLASSVGIPVVYREVNIPQEIMRAELARDRAQREDFRDAIRSGDLGSARQWPGLRETLDQIAQLDSEGVLDAYRNQARTGASRGSIVSQALTQGVLGG